MIKTEPLYDQHQYETLKYSGRLEILDPTGRVALFKRHQRVRFLEDNVGVLYDRVWGLGVLFATYVVRDARILEPIRTPKGYVVPLALSRPFRKGETFDLVTQRKIVGAFVKESYWDSAMHAPTDLLEMTVVSARRLSRPEIIAPPRGDFDATASSNVVKMRVRGPALYDTYKLSWSRT